MCKKREQLIACNDHDCGQGYYELGLRVFYSPELLVSRRFTPEQMEKTLFLARAQNKRDFTIFYEEKMSPVFPTQKNTIKNFKIEFDLSLCAREKPVIALNDVKAEICAETTVPIAYSEMNALAFSNKNDVKVRFLEDYNKAMGFNMRYDGVKKRQFAEQYSTAVTNLCRQAVAQYFAEEELDIFFIGLESKIYVAKTAEDLQQDLLGISLTAPHRKPQDTLNAQQVIYALENDGLPFYTAREMKDFSDVLHDHNKAIMGFKGTVSVLGEKLKSALNL